MSEILDVFDLQGRSLGDQDRKQFYAQAKEEYSESGKVTKKVKTVRILVLSTEGRMYLQKRSALKSDNPGLYDKTVGGHISRGETPTIAAVRECAEELGFPAAVLPSEEFDPAVRSTDLEIIGLLRQVQIDEDYVSKRETKSGEFAQPYICYFYIGYYDGSIRFKDGESSGLETFSLDELKSELEDKPDKFTNDLKDMIDRFSDYLKPLPPQEF